MCLKASLILFFFLPSYIICSQKIQSAAFVFEGAPIYTVPCRTTAWMRLEGMSGDRLVQSSVQGTVSWSRLPQDYIQSDFYYLYLDTWMSSNTVKFEHLCRKNKTLPFEVSASIQVLPLCIAPRYFLVS